MYTIPEDRSTETASLVDASHVFNSINRNIFLHNIATVCYLIARNDQNCY